MRNPLFLTFCAILLSTQAWSQVTVDVPSAEQARADVFGGFSLAGGGVLGTNYGFNGGADFRLFPHVFLVADVSQFSHPKNGENSSSDTAFLFGPRYLIPIRSNSRTSAFGQFLAGGDTFHNNGQTYTFTYNSATTFALAAEGGLDYAWNKRFSARFEGGYLHSSLEFSTYGGPANPSATASNRGIFAADVDYRF